MLMLVMMRMMMLMLMLMLLLMILKPASTKAFCEDGDMAGAWGLFVYLPPERLGECVYSVLYGELSTNAQGRVKPSQSPLPTIEWKNNIQNNSSLGIIIKKRKSKDDARLHNSHSHYRPQLRRSKMEHFPRIGA